jgi:hypothetical protein
MSPASSASSTVFSLAVHLRSVDRWLPTLCLEAIGIYAPLSQEQAEHDTAAHISLPHRLCFVDRVPWSYVPLDALLPAPWLDRLDLEMGVDWNAPAHYCEPLFHAVPAAGRYLLLHVAVEANAHPYHFLLHILPAEVRLFKVHRNLFRQETLYPMLRDSEFGRAWFLESRVRERTFASLFAQSGARARTYPLRATDPRGGALFIEALRVRTKSRERRKWLRTLRSGFSKKKQTWREADGEGAYKRARARR